MINSLIIFHLKNENIKNEFKIIIPKLLVLVYEIYISLYL